MMRRELMAAAASFGAAGAVATAAGSVRQAAGTASPDAELLAMADRFAAAREAYEAFDGADDSPENRALWNAYTGAFAFCLAARPTTLDGLAAKVRVFRIEAMEPDGSFIEPDQSWQRVAWSVCEDVLRMGGVRP